MRTIQTQVLICADDIVLIADTHEKIQRAVIEWTETLKEKGMKVNVKKSQVMQVCKMEDQVDRLNISCDGSILEQTQQYSYLGTSFQQNGKIQEEIQNRVHEAISAYYQISQTIFG